MATLHARAMTIPAPWSAPDFARLLSDSKTFLVTTSLRNLAEEGPAQRAPRQHFSAFGLGRVVLDEAELLTLAVDPSAQRRGLGRTCLTQFEAEAARRGAAVLHLEVAAENTVAIGLYQSAGWTEVGCRKDYYKGALGRSHAVLMSKHLHPA